MRNLSISLRTKDERNSGLVGEKGERERGGRCLREDLGIAKSDNKVVEMTWIGKGHVIEDNGHCITIMIGLQQLSFI